MPDDALDPYIALIGELHATLGRLGLALSLARDAFAWTDRQGRIVWCNPAFARLVRADHIAVLGTALSDRLPLERAGRRVVGDAHPARRLLIATDELDEVYELAFDGHRRVFAVYGRRGEIDGEPVAVLVIQDVTDSVRARAELERLNARLDAANAELEAFSYSVSHDLRTPLRAIDGFSQALVEDYARVLDREGIDCLERLRAAARSMGRLIEDLQRLARVTRAELTWTDVDLSTMCRAIAAELAASEPDRAVELVVADGLTVRADERLLYQAVQNLIANAWKFTGKTDRARIEIGSMHEHGEPVLFVRDNGAGFDMARADKLFAAFERLHSTSEFPGTGIGLAIARRIIHRHGGRIWAEGEPGRGATFYFTVPAEPGSGS
ncbi:MAG TPA: ATP-binding protein [Kofleriaceae bacterium]|jgi:signal transduction histidine kinase|nr:ATP-binding protein [Kofleriaceae bacterium]